MAKNVVSIDVERVEKSTIQIKAEKTDCGAVTVFADNGVDEVALVTIYKNGAMEVNPYFEDNRERVGLHLFDKNDEEDIEARDADQY